MDVGGEQTVAAVHVLVGVEVFVEPVHDGRHDLEGGLAQVHCTYEHTHRKHTYKTNI